MISAARVDMSSSRAASDDFSDVAAAAVAPGGSASVTCAAILRLDGMLLFGDCMRQPTSRG